MRLAFCVLPLLLILALVGCGKKASEEIDFGSVENSVYRNRYFGLALKIPDGWSVQDQEAQRRLIEMGTELVAGDDKQLRKAITKSSELQTVNLLSAFQHPLGAPVDFNPNLMSQAERVRRLPGIKRGSDYFFHLRKMLEASQIKMKVKEECNSETFGGVSFDVLESEMSFGKKVIRQKIYATIMKDYALCLTTTYSSEEQAVMLHHILESLKFEATSR